MRGGRGLTILVFAGATAVWGGIAYLGATLDADAVASRVRELGVVGPLVLGALLALQCVLAPLPSEPLMMAAGFVYGSGPGALLGWVGVVLGASCCFALGRHWGRPFAAHWVTPARLASLDRAVSGRGQLGVFAVLIALRAGAFMAFDVVSYASGLLKVPFWVFLVASALGVIPKVVAFTALGASVGGRPGWVDALIAAGMLGVLVLIPWLVRSARRAPATD